MPHAGSSQVVALVCFLFFGGMLPSGSGLLRFRSADGWSPCSNKCGPGTQARGTL
jgi:hypothetical protein